jgi:hypothetical protein
MGRRRRRCQGRLIPMRPPREVSWAAPLLGPACVNPRMHAWQGVVVADTIVVAEGARPHGAGLLWLRRLSSLRRCLSCLRWCLRCSTARSRGRFLPFAWLFAAKPLHENGLELCRDDHALEDDLELARVGYVVVLNEVALSQWQNLAQCDVRTIIAELLLEDDYVIRKDDFLQGDHVRSLSDLGELGCRKVHTQRRRLAHENTVQTAAVRVHLDFLAVGVHRTPEVVLECTTPIRVESRCEEHRLLPECHIPSIFREWVPPFGIW